MQGMLNLCSRGPAFIDLELLVELESKIRGKRWRNTSKNWSNPVAGARFGSTSPGQQNWAMQFPMCNQFSQGRRSLAMWSFHCVIFTSRRRFRLDFV